MKCKEQPISYANYFAVTKCWSSANPPNLEALPLIDFEFNSGIKWVNFVRFPQVEQSIGGTGFIQNLQASKLVFPVPLVVQWQFMKDR